MVERILERALPSSPRSLLPLLAVLALLVVAPTTVVAGQVEEQAPAPEAPVQEAPATEAPVDSQPAEEADDADTGAGITISIDDGEEDDRNERRRRRPVDKDTQVHVGSDLVVREDEVARDAIVISGSLDIQGKVIGDAICILGSATIDGEVTGEVVVVGGSVELGPNAEIMGDVTSVGGTVDRASGSRILGQVNEISIGPGVVWPELPQMWHWDPPAMWDMWHMGVSWSIFWTLFKWVMLILLTSVVFLLAREPVERTSRQLSGEFWKSSLLGLVAIVFFPFLLVMVVIVLAITIIGIPLLIVVVPLAVMLLLFALLLGYTAAAYSVGGWLGRRFGWSIASPYASLVIGIVAIQLLSLVGHLLGSIGGFLWFFAMMFGLAGWFVRFIAWTAGLGAALLTQLGRREPGFAPPPPAALPDAVDQAATPSPSAPGGEQPLPDAGSGSDALDLPTEND